MLHPTHRSSFLQSYHPSPCPSLSSPSLPHSLSSSSSSSSLLKVGTGMECVEAALKGSFRKDMAGVKASAQTQPFSDDFWPFNNKQYLAPSDEFLVDELLDFSNDDGLVEDTQEKDELRSLEEAKAVPSAASAKESFLGKDDFGSLPAAELSVPADDLADLEWLSHFVDDSFSEFSSAFPSGFSSITAKNWANDENRPDSKAPVSVKPCLTTQVRVKARRSKRSRTEGRVWSLRSLLLADVSSSCSSSSSSSSPSSDWLIGPNPGHGLEPVENMHLESNQPTKKQKKPARQGFSLTQPPRRCSHCGAQKTPQWRAGPLGAKTLCNACGVRFKSGRLLPEYRPACSPTFSSELHSNHHRKVLEMRRNKEMLGRSESGLAVPSF